MLFNNRLKLKEEQLLEWSDKIDFPKRNFIVTILNEFVERRGLKRFKVKEGAFAALMPDSNKLGQILDMGKGGLSFLYIDTGEATDGSTELDIYVSGNEFYLSKLPVKVVSDIRVPNKIPINPIVMRRQGVQFGELTSEQTSLLNSFMRQYTIGEA
ncbi:MAG: PilZ domain-containing protein [Thermodesulfobacteriota bacterium]